MSWTLKLRGDSTAPILAEYECPVHGQFEVTVQRPAPDAMPCPVLVEYEHHCEDPPCSDCGYTTWECNEHSPWRFPTPVGRVKPGEVAQGKVMEYPPGEVCLDTRVLADDPSPSGYAKWKGEQRAITRDLGLRRARSGRR